MARKKRGGQKQSPFSSAIEDAANGVQDPIEESVEGDEIADTEDDALLEETADAPSKEVETKTDVKPEEPKKQTDYQKHMADWESKKEKAAKAQEKDPEIDMKIPGKYRKFSNQFERKVK